MLRLKLAPAGDFGMGETKRGPLVLGLAGATTALAMHAALIAGRMIGWWVLTARVEAEIARERAEGERSASPRRRAIAVWAGLL